MMTASHAHEKIIDRQRERTWLILVEGGEFAAAAASYSTSERTIGAYPPGRVMIAGW
jgi:hypothetical protein